MKNLVDDSLPEFLRSARKRVGAYLLLSGVLIALIVYLVVNTISLTKTLSEDARVYAADIMQRTERDVVSRLSSLDDRATGLAMGFRMVPDDYLGEFLDRLNESSSRFDGILLLDEQGVIAQSGSLVKGVVEWAEGLQDPFDGPHIASMTGKDFVICVPVTGSARPMALVCQQKQSDLNQALDGVLFDNLCFSCIVDGTGSVVVMPNNPLPIDEYKAISDPETKEHFVEILEGVDREAGDTDDRDFIITQLPNPMGDDTFMACIPLEYGDWYLMTFVPVSLFTRHAELYIQHYWAPILLACIVFGVLLVTIWRDHYKSVTELTNMLYVDPLTGGLTDAAFQKRARDLAKANEGEPYRVVCFRILAFHNVNEHYGADIAYAMIKEIHEALCEKVADDELVARSERDRFYLLVHAHDLDVLQGIVDDLVAAMRAAAEKVAPMGSFTVAQGCCSAAEEHENIRLLEDRAARAASYSERLGRCVFYCVDLDEKIEREIVLDQSYSQALASGQFEVYLQPKMGIRAGCGMAAEALVRWNHPDLGMVSPGEFIPLFERNRRISSLDTYVFETVCKMIADWNRGDKFAGMPVSVNLSRVCLIDQGLDIIDDLAAIKDRYGIPDGQIGIEITETVSLDFELFGLMRDVVARVHQHGMTCSFDDFGFGYSSLSLLKDLEFDAIKLDRHFFMGDTERAWKIIESFVSMSHSLGMAVVAEGVEDPEQVEHLKRLGCDYIQGYVYSRPLPQLDFERWADQHGGTGAQSGDSE